MWRQFCPLYITNVHRLGRVLRTACQYELVDVMTTLLLDINSPHVASLLLEQVAEWPQDMLSSHPGVLAVRSLTRTAGSGGSSSTASATTTGEDTTSVTAVTLGEETREAGRGDASADGAHPIRRGTGAPVIVCHEERLEGWRGR